jgi:16S rRNA (cytidine1402-2'-O)-methyltransferase
MSPTVETEPNGGTAPRKLEPGLYLVATPLGNLGDITRRAIVVLSQADLIACEDTRVTRRLLAAFGIPAPRLVRYDDHSAERVRSTLIEAVRHGKTVALVSDAGTPLIADPGYRLVRAAHEAGLLVNAVPGPSAVVAALAVSGLPCDRFLFCGFLPPKAGPRARALEAVKTVPASLVVFEAPHRLPAALASMAAVLGPREAAVARELTKLHEEVRRGTLATLAAHYAAAGAPKGEVVIVVGPPPDAAPPDAADDLDAQLETALAKMSLRDAAAAVATASGRPRREVYARALALARGK